MLHCDPRRRLEGGVNLSLKSGQKSNFDNIGYLDFRKVLKKPKYQVAITKFHEGSVSLKGLTTMGTLLFSTGMNMEL